VYRPKQLPWRSAKGRLSLSLCLSLSLSLCLCVHRCRPPSGSPTVHMCSFAPTHAACCCRCPSRANTRSVRVASPITHTHIHTHTYTHTLSLFLFVCVCIDWLGPRLTVRPSPARVAGPGHAQARPCSPTSGRRSRRGIVGELCTLPRTLTQTHTHAYTVHGCAYVQTYRAAPPS
jgi:hypothetical protein